MTLAGRSTDFSGTILPAAPSYFRAQEVPGGMPRLELLHLVGNAFQLRLEGTPGRSYTIQSSPNLVGAINWSNLSTLILTNPTGTLSWTNSTEAPRFFRARQP
mgnify:CR=1 FL=1